MPSQNAMLHRRSRRLGAIDALALAAGGYDAAVLGDSPFAFWKLNETSGTAAADATGNGHDGVYTGSPTLGVTGAFDKGVTLNGSSQYIGVTGLTGLSNNSPCTIEAIIKYVSGTGCIFSFGASTGGNLNDLRVNNSTQMLYYWFSNDYTQTVAALAGAWHHVAAVFTGTKRQIYVDGVQQGADNTASSPNWTLSGLTVGSLRGAGEFFNGSMQRVAYYQTALSAATILVHSNAIAVS